VWPAVSVSVIEVFCAMRQAKRPSAGATSVALAAGGGGGGGGGGAGVPASVPPPPHAAG
jgi:hypothetical protein